MNQERMMTMIVLVLFFLFSSSSAHQILRFGNSPLTPLGSFSTFLPTSGNSSLIYGISSHGCSDLLDIRGCFFSFDPANPRVSVLSSIKTLDLPIEAKFAELSSGDFLAAGGASAGARQSYGTPGILRLRQPGWLAEPLLKFQGFPTRRFSSLLDGRLRSPNEMLQTSSIVMEYFLEQFKRLDGYFYLAFMANQVFYQNRFASNLLMEPVILMRFPETENILSTPTMLSDSLEILHITFPGPLNPSSVSINSTGKSFLILHQVGEKLSGMEFPFRKFSEILNQQGAENKRKINQQRIDFNTFSGIPLVNISMADQTIAFEPSFSLNFPVSPPGSAFFPQMYHSGSSLYGILQSNYSFTPTEAQGISRFLQIDLSVFPPVWRQWMEFPIIEFLIEEKSSATFSLPGDKRFLLTTPNFYGLFSTKDNALVESYSYIPSSRRSENSIHYPYRNLQNQLSLLSIPHIDNYRTIVFSTISPNGPEKSLIEFPTDAVCDLVSLLFPFSKDSQVSSLTACIAFDQFEIKQISQDGQRFSSLVIPLKTPVLGWQCHARPDSLRGWCFFLLRNQTMLSLQFSAKWPTANVFPMDLQYRFAPVRDFPSSSFDLLISSPDESSFGRELFFAATDSQQGQIRIVLFSQSLENPQFSLVANNSLKVERGNNGIFIGRVWIFQSSPGQGIIEFHQFSLDTKQFSFLARFQGISSYSYQFAFQPFPYHWRDSTNGQVQSLLPGKSTRLYGILIGSLKLQENEGNIVNFNDSGILVNPYNYTLLTLDLVGKSIVATELPFNELFFNGTYDNSLDITALPIEIPGSGGKLRFYFFDPDVHCISGRRTYQYDTETRKFSLALKLPMDSFSRGVTDVNPYGPELLIAQSNSSSCRGYQFYRYQERSGASEGEPVPNSIFERVAVGFPSPNLVFSSTFFNRRTFPAPQARDYILDFLPIAFGYSEDGFFLSIFIRIPWNFFKLQAPVTMENSSERQMIGSLPVPYFLAILIPLLILILSVILLLVKRSRQRTWENRKAQVIAMQTVRGKAATPTGSTKAPLPVSKPAPAAAATAVVSV